MCVQQKFFFIIDWDNSYFSKLWPGWDATIVTSGAKVERSIDDIGKAVTAHSLGMEDALFEGIG